MRLMTTPSLSKQSGIALIVSLIILLLLTMMGISSMKVNSLEEKMSGNDLDRNTAFQAAEAGLRAGEAKIGELWNKGAADTVPPIDSGLGSIQQFCNGVIRGAINDIPGVFHAVATTTDAGSGTVKNRTSLVEMCGDCDGDCPVPDEKDPSTWTDDNKSVEVSVEDEDPVTGKKKLAAQPRYFITYIYSKHFPDSTKDRPIYKFSVTARGVGKNPQTVVLLRSYFGGSTGFIED